MKISTRNYSLNAVLIMFGLIGILLVLQAWVRYNDFISNQRALMENEVEVGGREIERLVNELHNEVSIFAEEKYEIINFLASYPDSEDISEHIQSKVAALFPDYLSLTILDDNSLPRYYSNEAGSDVVCLDDIIHFNETGKRAVISIHDYKNESHFDVMATWGRTRVRGILKISFSPSIIARSLQISETAGHNLVLLHKDKNGLIEVSASGARIYPMAGKTGKLDGEDLLRIGASYDVDGTRWRLVALPAPTLYREQLQFILVQTVTIMMAIALVSFIMLRTINRAEQRRLKSESEVVAARVHLQQALDFSEVYMCRWDTQTDKLVWSENVAAFFNDDLPGDFNSYLEMLDGSARAKLRSKLNHCLVTNEPYQNEHIIHLPGGQQRWLEMSGNYEVNNQSGHIEMISLVRDVTERKHAEHRRIEAEKSQRDTLVREVHHRIKNHLQGVVGLLRQHTIKNPEISDVIDMAAGQLHSVSTVYGLQSKQQKSSVGINELVMEICKANEGMLGASINYTSGGRVDTDARISEERAVAIALIINELMTNAIKHSAGLAQTGIQVDVQTDATGVTICIKNVFDHVSDDFDFEAGKGLGTGLTLIRSLIPGKGASLSIRPDNHNMRAELRLGSPVIRNDV